MANETPRPWYRETARSTALGGWIAVRGEPDLIAKFNKAEDRDLAVAAVNAVEPKGRRPRTDRWQQIHALMMRLPTKFALHWCGAERCACMGCVNGNGEGRAMKLTREEWVDYILEHIEPILPTSKGDA